MAYHSAVSRPFGNQGSGAASGEGATCEIDGLTRIGKYDAVIPAIAGQAWITGFYQLGMDPSDPYQEGFTMADTWMQAL